MGLDWVYKRVFFVLRGVRLRAGSRRMGFMPNIKKAKKMGFAPVYGSDAFPAGLGSPAPKALGFSRLLLFLHF